MAVTKRAPAAYAVVQPPLHREKWLAAAAALALSTGCISSRTDQTLDGSYQAATARLPQKAERSTEDTAASEAKLAGPLERDLVVAEAVARSPALAVMAHRARALVHAGRAEGSLPPAMLGFEVWDLPLERPYSLNEASMYMVELSQTFPAAGSLDARARAMAEEAAAMVAELSSEERLIAERAASAFADYAQAHAEKRLQARQSALLSRMAEAVRARFSTGGAGLADAARIEVELAKTERALARIEGDLARARATLNAVLRRAPGAPLGEPRELPPETVTLPLDDLLERAEANRGATLSADAKVRAASARKEAAKAEAHVPEFMVGISYMQEPTMRPGMGVASSMSLPWFWGPTRERVRQAEAEEAAERSARDSAEIEAGAEVGGTYAMLRALEAQLSLVESQSLPATKRSMEALTTAFATGNASLLEWVDVARAMLDLELEIAALRGDLSRGVASLERAVGAALPRSPLSEVTP